MITFKPNKIFKDKFNKIDYRSLSLTYSLLYDSASVSNRRNHYYVELLLSKKPSSYYNFMGCASIKNVKIYINNDIKGERGLHADLLHEFRHFLQDNVFKIPLCKRTYDESTHSAYMASPVEIDARAYEKQLLSKVIRLYERLNKQKENIKYISGYKGK